MIASTLAYMRRSGVEISTDGEDLIVDKATPAQIEAVKTAKPQILAALRAEAFTGIQLAENSALFAGLEITYNATVDNMEAGVEPQMCLALIALVDLIAQHPLTTALNLYMGLKSEMEAYIARINEGRRLLLEGRALEGAVRHVFPPSRTPPKPKESLNASIF